MTETTSLESRINRLAEERTERVHRYERVYGQFERSFTLPATVDAAHVKATYSDGVLTITLPKVEKAPPRQVPVEVAKREARRALTPGACPGSVRDQGSETVTD